MKRIFTIIATLAFAFAIHPVSARILMVLGESDNYEIPRSKLKTYFQTGSLQNNLRHIRTMKPSAFSDDELATIPDRYLTPELRARQKAAKVKLQREREHPMLPSKREDTVIIQARKKTTRLKIDEAVWVPSKGDDNTILAPQKRLPEVELLKEIKAQTSGNVSVELNPGDPREIFQLFEHGKTKDPAKLPLLDAFEAYRSQDYATAVTVALGVIASARSTAELRVNARYLLAHSLYQAGFYASALPVLVDLSTSKWRRSVVGIAAKVIERTRDDASANQILTRISLSQIPDEFRPLFSFHLGRILMNSGAAGAAIAAFERVTLLHPRYPEAQYYIGVIKSSELGTQISESDWEAQGTAVYETRMRFEQALLGSRTSDAKDLHNLAALSLARLAYQAKQYNQAVYYYQSVESSSPFVREAIFETAWSLFRLGEFNRSLGTLHPLGSEYFESRDLPELWILRSLNYLKLCRFDEAQKAANTFEALANQLTPDLRSSQGQLNHDPIARPSDIPHSSLPEWVRHMLVTDAVVRKDRSQEDLLLEERNRLATLKNNQRVQDPDLRNSAADTLVAALDRKVLGLGGNLRPYLLQRVSDLQGEYRTQRERLDFLRFEIYSQANRFPGALERPEAKKLLAKKEFLPGVFLKGHEILWRFTGEYWFDELRGYDYFIPTECRTEDKL